MILGIINSASDQVGMDTIEALEHIARIEEAYWKTDRRVDIDGASPRGAKSWQT
jgi:hypothetical protein